MSVRVTDNSLKIAADIDAKSALFIRFLMDDVETYSKPLTPKKEGRLREGIQKQVLGTRGTMVWKKVYAMVQERGMIKGHNIRNYTTPGTGPHFAYQGVQKAIRFADRTMRKARLIE